MYLFHTRGLIWSHDFSVYYIPQYLNSGAGGISGIFLHDRHADDPPKHLLGWWSNKKETRRGGKSGQRQIVYYFNVVYNLLQVQDGGQG